MAAAAVADGLFAQPFAAAVHRLRIGGVVFLPGAELAAVEHVVAGVVHQQRVVGRGPLRQQRRCGGVDGMGQRDFILGLIDRGIGRGIDNDVGLQGVQRRAEGVRGRQIELPAAGAAQHPVQRQRAPELEADLATAAGDQDFCRVVHGWSPYCCVSQSR
ncbi:hypothetical protein D3C85_1266620 [compost metagenome]